MSRILKKEIKMSIAQDQVNHQTNKLYIIANVLKYESINLIIFYYYTYSGLLGTIGIIVQNSIRFMRNTEFCPWIDG